MGDIILSWLSETGWKIFLILMIAAVVYLMINHLVPLTIRRALIQQMKGKPEIERGKRTDTLVRLISSVSAIGIGIITVLIVLQQAGVDITAAIAGLGIVGIAVGFGAQYLVRDLIAGFFVLLENQYNVGDVIRVGDIAGTVEEISMRRTILSDLDGARHIIPHGEVRIVSNLTQDQSRAHLNISVAYKEDLDRVMLLMRKTWEEMAQDSDWSSFILSKTPWLLRVDEFGDSGITIKIVGDTQPIKQWDVMGEFRRRIKKVFDQEGIEIPWPHLKVYMGDTEVKEPLKK